MDFLIHKLLKISEAKEVAKNILINKKDWQDGKFSAGSHAAAVKENLQLNKDSKTSIENGEFIKKNIVESELLKNFTLPKSIHGITFSHTSAGGGYGNHVDNAYMSSGRSDLSFTLFLSDPKDYEGGELCIQTIQESKNIKLEMGTMIIYPSTSLHSVEKVTSGERLVCVGWIESYIASNDDRNIMFGLNAGARGILARHGKSDELDLIFQSYNNLLRRLGD